jgi:protein involved in polysaccharide export with SLBB domain
MFGCCPQFYSVAGAVRSPGRQVYDDPVSLFDAINAAGGMTRKADPTRVSITHTDVAIATIDLTRPESEEGRKFQVQPGMRILVPSSPWWWLK